MEKYIIRFHDNNQDAHLIFHATPKPLKINAYDLYEHQWYITGDKHRVGFPIEGQSFESFATSTKIIKEKGYEGLYLYCKRLDKRNNKEDITEFIRLYSDVNKIIDCETAFDKITAYGENGMIL